MGIFSRRDPLPTATDLREEDDAISTSAEGEKRVEDGLRVENGAKGQHRVDPELEKKVVRKLDWHVPPLVAFLFLLSFLDRGNIGNARIAGMDKDILDNSSSKYAWLSTIFYIAYIIFQFQAFMWRIIPPHTWACFIVFAWGVVATCQAATQSWAGEMVCRFLLGAAEAGFGPSIPYLLSFFYLRHELGFRIGIFLAAAPLATMFSGALAYGITSGHSTLANWRLLFLVEGLPTIIMGPVSYFFLPDSPVHARFLNEEEKEIARARGVRQTGHVERVGGLVWSDIGATLLDLKVWITPLMYFSCNVSYSSLPVFLPTVLKEMGFSSVHAQGLSAPPYFVSFCVTIGSAWLADRIQQRGLVIFVLSIIGCLGYILLAACESVGARYFGTFLAASGVFPAIANILPWVLNNQGSDTRRGMGIVLLNTIGQVGPILGTRIFPNSEAPRFIKGQAICAAFMGFNALLALCLRILLQWENKKLDKQYGVVDKETQRKVRDGQAADANVAEENYGAAFRYIL